MSFLHEKSVRTADDTQIVHWDGKGWYASAVSEFHGGRAVVYCLHAANREVASRLANHMGLGTPFWLAEKPV